MLYVNYLHVASSDSYVLRLFHVYFSLWAVNEFFKISNEFFLLFGFNDVVDNSEQTPHCRTML